MPFDQHVRFANRVTLGIQFLPVHDKARLGIDLVQMIIGNTEHAARSRRRVVHCAHHAWLSECVVIFYKKKIDHQTNDFARREVFTCGFVGEFGKLSDEFFKDRAHFGVGDLVWMQVNGGEFFRDHIKQVCLGEAINLRVEVKLFKDVAHCRREAMDIRAQVRAQVVLITHELFQIQR